MDKISIIVPCFNEEDVVSMFYQETTKQLHRISDIDYELLFINDGSKDHTASVLKELAEKDSHCFYFTFSRNFGKEAAMFAGLEKATGDYVVIMDADLQHPPRLLPDMYHACKYEGYDCAAGKRVDRTGEGRLRNFLSHSFYKVIQKLTKMDMDDGAGDFRMMSRQMVDAILELKEYNRYMKGLFSFVGFDTKWIEFHNVERAAGQTKWNFTSLFSYAFKGIFSFSATPITFAGIIGTFLIFLSLIISVISVVMHYHTLVINLILFLSGVQLIFVSILGQYCTSCYFETKKRPIYIIKDTNRKY
ncbi:MAG: glycosyltransferase family 2 protein [Catenibacterium mitsuokai]|jgi:glycosyltransferase involved in cell wall biosynthesis|uniref:glycosyltransferase family 2 protein n=1 Tax=Catenibacterium TaxID=135858 RepID=UPI002A81DA47|nr:glycosyltransferase family 2 protein [Catenibacterium mitsuokai]MDY3675537.1 glycosyltransferase family 2 protein [Catenibacterium mitsuokai]